MPDWRSLGTAHRRRNDAVLAIAQGQDERDNARSMTSLVRWPGIVRAIRAIAAAYNEGVGRQLLVVTETTDPQHPSAVLESTDAMIPALLVTLDDSELRVDTRPPHPDGGGVKRWVDLTRTDDDTAAYVVQAWMERL